MGRDSQRIDWIETKKLPPAPVTSFGFLGLLHSISGPVVICFGELDLDSWSHLPCRCRLWHWTFAWFLPLPCPSCLLPGIFRGSSLINHLHTKAHLQACFWVTNLRCAFSLPSQDFQPCHICCLADAKNIWVCGPCSRRSALFVGSTEPALCWEHLGEGNFE